jgi:hypothetical protein
MVPMNEPTETPDVVAIRPFVPSKDFATCVRFYEDLGFSSRLLGGGIAGMQMGAFGFLLQEYDVPGFAANFMMHMTVNDLDRYWEKISGLDLAARYGVRAPTAPAMQPWGLVITYVVDPTGVLWHIAQQSG